MRYVFLRVELYARNGKPTSIDVLWDDIGIEPEKIFLEIYNGSEPAEQIELKSDEPEKDFIRWKAENKSFDRLCIRAEYENQKVFRKEIWNKGIPR